MTARQKRWNRVLESETEFRNEIKKREPNICPKKLAQISRIGGINDIPETDGHGSFGIVSEPMTINLSLNNYHRIILNEDNLLW